MFECQNISMVLRISQSIGIKRRTLRELPDSGGCRADWSAARQRGYLVSVGKRGSNQQVKLVLPAAYFWQVANYRNLFSPDSMPVRRVEVSSLWVPHLRECSEADDFRLGIATAHVINARTANRKERLGAFMFE